MPRWLAHFCVVVGWLLTPVLAWGASYLGLMIGAAFAVRLATPVGMLVTAGAGAAVLGFATLFVWIRFMRRVPHLLSHLMAPRASQEHSAIVTGD